MESSSAKIASPTTHASRVRQARVQLQQGLVIPAHPLALTTDLKIDERRQRALTRYYLAAGAGGIAVGVHTTQFQIHVPTSGMLQPVLELAFEEMNRSGTSLVGVAGICGDTRQATREAELARELGYHFGLLNLGDMRGSSVPELLEHCRAVGEIIGLFGFYLQAAVGGIELPYEFWRGFCEVESVVAIKVAAFNRYQTLMVLRAVAESGRNDIALYTGNDDSIITDLVTPFRFKYGEQHVTERFTGGLLGQWAVWTRRAVEILESCREISFGKQLLDRKTLQLAAELTDANGAIFDAANNFRGCIPGIHEILRRQGLLEGNWCLDEKEQLSPGQAAEVDRVLQAYPHLQDDEFVQTHLDEWLSG